jgi:hypothetical protein
MTSIRRSLAAAVVCGAALSIDALGTSAAIDAQNPDQDAARAMADGSREVVRTAPTAADRFDTAHAIVYVDKGLLTTEAGRKFAADVDRMFAATSKYLQRTFDSRRRNTAKPAYYLTNRAGISHAESTRIFLAARRVIPTPAIVVHESVHLLLMRNPDAPRNRDDLTPSNISSSTPASPRSLACTRSTSTARGPLQTTSKA